MKRIFLSALPLAALALSCASARPAKPAAISKPAPVVVVPAPPAKAEPEAPLPPPVSVAWIPKMPASPVIDGNLGEWGVSSPPKSHVEVAITKEAAFVIADLVEEAKDGVWLGVSFPSAPLAPIGNFQRGGGVATLNCETDDVGQPLGAPEADACRAVLERHAAFVAAYEARFVKTFRLDKEGLRVLGMGGALEVIEGAVVVAKAKPGGMIVEARLPLAALPRMTQAPLDSVLLFPSTAPVTKPLAVAEDQWIGVSAPEPVSFEPSGDIRAASYLSTRSPLYTVGFSYHPAAPNVVEIVKYMPGAGGLALEAEEKVLFESAAKAGDIEVGSIGSASPLLGILKGGKLVDATEIQGEAVGAVVVKKKDIHVFSFRMFLNDDGASTIAQWSVTAVDQEGAYTNPINPETGIFLWREVYEFHSDKFDRFGLRGIPASFADEETPRPVEVTWRFDKEFGGYMPTTRVIENLPKKPAPKKK